MSVPHRLRPNFVGHVDVEVVPEVGEVGLRAVVPCPGPERVVGERRSVNPLRPIHLVAQKQYARDRKPKQVVLHSHLLLLYQPTILPVANRELKRVEDS